MDSILRNSQREEPVIQQVVQAQGYRQGPQFGLPGPYQNRSLLEFVMFVGCLDTMQGIALHRERFNQNLSDLLLGDVRGEEVLVMALLEREEEE